MMSRLLEPSLERLITRNPDLILKSAYLWMLLGEVRCFDQLQTEGSRVYVCQAFVSFGHERVLGLNGKRNGIE